MGKKKIAVVLSGCGVYDGSEIHEAVCTLLAIDKFGATYQCFAPDIDQHHVIDHLSGKEMKETRNVLIEAARIARGNILPLDNFEASDFDAIIIPGGFGVAKNLCTFALHGSDCTVDHSVELALKNAYAARIPIGALCIAPALIAKVLGNVKVTIGNDEGTANAIQVLGAIHINSSSDDIVVDLENKIVSTPCYMLDSPISTIASGAEKVVGELLKIASA